MDKMAGCNPSSRIFFIFFYDDKIKEEFYEYLKPRHANLQI